MAEGDWDRNFIELGLVVGWIFVALRIMFALWLLLISVRAARSGDPMVALTRDLRSSRYFSRRRLRCTQLMRILLGSRPG